MREHLQKVFANFRKRPCSASATSWRRFELRGGFHLAALICLCAAQRASASTQGARDNCMVGPLRWKTCLTWSGWACGAAAPSSLPSATWRVRRTCANTFFSSFCDIQHLTKHEGRSAVDALSLVLFAVLSDAVNDDNPCPAIQRLPLPIVFAASPSCAYRSLIPTETPACHMVPNPYSHFCASRQRWAARRRPSGNASIQSQRKCSRRS